MKSNLILASIFLFLLTTPVLAQVADPGNDPDVPAAPIDDYVLLLAFVGIVVVFMKFRNIRTKKIKRQNLNSY